MSRYIKSENTFRVSADGAMNIFDQLPAANYIIKVDVFGAMYLEIVDSFTFSGKRYGDNIRHTDRIMNTFIAREASTGVMLAGEKGSGKSLLAKSLSISAAEAGIPTIIINSPFKGDAFNKLIQDINQPCIVMFDEFEKVYKREDQEAILTLLDGVFPTKKLFILTCNDKYRIDEHMRNRPGRIFYMIEFEGLTADFITEYCNDNLNDKSHIEKICRISGLFSQFNFDMLKALVEEMNRYNEGPDAALKMLNAKPEFDGGTTYETEFLVNDVVVDPKNRDTNGYSGNPLSTEGIRIDYDPEPDSDTAWTHIQFYPHHIVKIDPVNNMFELKADNCTLRLTKVVKRNFNFNAF